MAAARDAEIARLRSACGCKEGMLGLGLGLAAYLAFPDWFPHGASLASRVLIGAAIGLGCAVAGKLTALGVAQVRLRRLVRG
jgi:hypothetical protein